MQINGRNMAVFGMAFIGLGVVVYAILMTSALDQLGPLDSSNTLARSLLYGILVAGIVAGIVVEIMLVRLIDARNALEDRVAERTQELETANASLEQKSEGIRSLNELSGLLQAARTMAEAQTILEGTLPKFFPRAIAGGLYLTRESRNLLESLVVWGGASQVFTPDDCWALRRGTRHFTEPEGLRCAHLSGLPDGLRAVCVPLIAAGETRGLFTVAGNETDFSSPDLLLSLSEQLSLSLANMRLRESLQEQSIRDPLTGLFNRRFMEETLEREMRRALRSERPLSVFMIDLDHFKSFNDEYGHKAGDALLESLALTIKTGIRDSDVPCRFGGEEFALILPETGLALAADRAEDIRARVAAMRVEYQGRVLRTVTASFGVASYPDHATNSDDLIRAADAALYLAKHAGRNRVVSAEKSDTPPGGKVEEK